MDDYLDRHEAMHHAALVHDLRPGGDHDLPVERIRIDRLLKEVLVGEGAELLGIADALASDDDYLQFLCNEMNYMQREVGERRFRLTQGGDQLPELSTEVVIGSARYHGFALDLNLTMPHVLSDGSIGRRLGELVCTGLPRLDQRIVKGVVTLHGDVVGSGLGEGWTRLQLDPDLVALGRS